MSGAMEVAGRAPAEIEELVADMLAGDYMDNEISLGMVLCGNQKIQVQLKVTMNSCDFLDDEEDDFEDEDARGCGFCGCLLEGGEMYHDVCDQCARENEDHPLSEY